MTSWVVREEDGVGEGFVTVPEDHWAELGVRPAGYVKVATGSRARYLRALVRESAAGCELFVMPGTFDLDAGATARAEVEPASTGRVRAHLALRTGNGIRSLVGLVLAIAATAAEAARSAHSQPSLAWIVVAAACQTLGLALVFVSGILNLAPGQTGSPGR